MFKQRGLAKLRLWYKENKSKDELMMAQKDLLLSIELNPKISESYFHLAIIYALQGDIVKADSYFDQAIKTSGDASMTVRMHDIRNMARAAPAEFLYMIKAFYR